jgi:hypothetical protein
MTPGTTRGTSPGHREAAKEGRLGDELLTLLRHDPILSTILRPVLDEARAAGFESVRFVRLRIGGANPGRIADFTVKLIR